MARVNRRRQSAVAVCLAGLAPAVVTETLYALAVRRPRVVPERLHIVTTRAGLAKVSSALLGMNGALAGLRRELGLPASAFRCAVDDVHVLGDARGEPLDDIVTSRDSEAVGEQLGRLVEHLASDSGQTLHCSLAGGRKTMGALLATALQLHGRPGDRLYHVLVSPPFDRAADFFFPTRRFTALTWPGGVLDARRARVSLAEVPIVRLGGVVRELGLTGATLRRLAAELEEDAAGRLRLEPVRVDLDHRLAAVGAQQVRMTPQVLALYAFYARERERCRRPGCAAGDRCEACQPTDDEVHSRRQELQTIYRSIARHGTLERGAAEETAADDLLAFRAWLQQTRSRLNARIRAVLGRGPRGARYAVTDAPPVRGEPQRRGLAVLPALVRFVGRQG